VTRENSKSIAGAETASTASHDPYPDSSTVKTVPDEAGSTLLADQYERWARESEAWARAIEAQLQRTQWELNSARAELTRVKHSISWRVTAPFRGVSEVTRAVAKDTLSQGGQSALQGGKSAVRALLDVGLDIAGRHDGLRHGVLAILRRIPRIGARLEAYAGARADERSDW